MRTKNNRAQINQAFIYVFILIIIGAVILLGFRFVNQATDSGCEAQVATFKKNIETLAGLHTDYGTLNIERVTAPCNYDLVCMINPINNGSESAPIHPIITDDFVLNQYFIQEGERDVNVFLVKGKEVTPLMKLDEIRVNVGFCSEVSAGKFELKFQGQGKTVLVANRAG